MSTMAASESAQPSGAAIERPVWHLPAARGAIGLAVGVGITFVQSHAAVVGLVAFAALALLTGLVQLALRGSVPAAARRWVLVAGAAGLVAGIAATALAAVAPTVESFAIVVGVWGLVVAVAEGWGAWRARGTSDVVERRIAIDWRTVAVLTAVTAIVFLVLPRHEVVLTGLLGAYGVIVGVFHAIAALSARPSRASEQQA